MTPNHGASDNRITEEGLLLERLTYLIQFHVYAEADEKDVACIIESLGERCAFSAHGGWRIVNQDADDAMRSCEPGQGEYQTSITMVRRDYYAPDREDHCPYQAAFHDHSDETVDQHRLFADDWKDGKRIDGLLAQAGVRDGDEFELIIRKTGQRPFGERRYMLQRDGHYEPETDAMMTFRAQHGRMWNYRRDDPLPATPNPPEDKG